MNRRLSFLVSALLGCAMVPNVALAQTAASLCRPEGTTFAFFNGVDTTRLQGEFALLKMRQIFPAVDGQGQTVRYELFYNWTNGLEDFVETFAQRLAEQQMVSERFELFAEFQHGGGSWLTALGSILPGLATSVGNFVEFVKARDTAALTAWLATPPTLANYRVHRTRLDTLMLQGNKILMFAHSQGNLFANVAYDYVKSKVGSTAVGLIHVAPASVITNGSHSLADKDVVINGLRVTGSVPRITQSIPGYLLREPGLNGMTDALGHGLLEIYLNRTLETRIEINQFVGNALAALRAPPATASNGFITVTLTWDGTGDVDLHTYEPGGAHVYYASRTGPSGFLDVDNTRAVGPEHYYATCDASRLQTGRYRVAINNYARASGRRATVQIASYNDGPLLTLDLDVGAERGSSGDSSPINVASFTIIKDPVTGRYSVTTAF